MTSSRRSTWSLRIVLRVLAFVVVLASVAPALFAAEGGEFKPKCVPAPKDLARPPNVVSPGGKSNTPPTQTVCPQGQVPEIVTPADKGGSLKGEPVLLEHSDPPDCHDGLCYYYADAVYHSPSVGAEATMSVEKPSLCQTGIGHSLEEVAVTDKPNGARNIVEIGWSVDRNFHSYPNPELFVFYWVNGVPHAYNDGWVQVSPFYYPGQTLGPNQISLGLVYSGNKWWGIVNGQPIGYFPGTLWPNAHKFKQAKYEWWYGEVAFTANKDPQHQMGNGNQGYYNSRCSNDATRMNHLCLYPAGAVSCSQTPSPVLQQYGYGAQGSNWYSTCLNQNGDISLGGPGVGCP